MRKRIFIFFTITIIFSILISSLIFSTLTRNLYEEDMQDNLLNLTDFIANDILQNDIEDFDELAKYYSKNLSNRNYDIRVTIIGFDGVVLGESNYDYLSMENHADRKEVVEAIENEVGISSRYSKTLKFNLLYVARVIEGKGIVCRVSQPLEKINEVLQKIVTYTIIASLIALVVAMIIAFSLSVSITAPVNKLVDASLEIYHGHLDKRVEIEAKDELKTLVDVFNNMTNRLEENINELKYDNEKINAIIHSIPDGIVAVDANSNILFLNIAMQNVFEIPIEISYGNKKLIEVIRNAKLNQLVSKALIEKETINDEITVIRGNKERLFRVYTTELKNPHEATSGAILFMQDITEIRKLELIRSEFVSNVTHELKTPLTSIRGFVETLRTGALEDQVMANRFLEIIDIESERLYNLITDILQLSEIENTSMVKEMQIVNVFDVVKETFDLLKKASEEKNVVLVNEVSADFCMSIHRSRLLQLLINLVDNAIKYNHEGGSVVVNADKIRGGVLLKVVDDGIGMDNNHLNRIFERFYRVDKGRSREAGGTGLGLSIVKHITKMFNGDIKVISEVNKGTTFIITFPDV